MAKAVGALKSGIAIAAIRVAPPVNGTYCVSSWMKWVSEQKQYKLM